jgi:Zn2+/Cd2+-exporting ATPase
MTGTKAACPACEVHTESVFRVEGMDCHEEVAILERRLRPMAGVESLSADVLSGRLRVQHDAARVTAADVAEAIATTGMRGRLETGRPDGAPATRDGLRKVVLVVLSGGAWVAGFVAEAAGAGRAWVIGAYAIAMLAGGVYTVRRAVAAARLLALDINVLMLVAVLGGVLIGQWSEAAAVLFLFALAQLLESRSMERARHAIRSLMELAPAMALVRREGAERTVSVDDLAVGDTIIVRPGEKIAMDGRVTAGESDVNQAPITGESVPVEKRAGDEVFAGTINGHGGLDVRVTRARPDTAMARIVALVEAAQAQRGPSQAFVERFARYYTPAVLMAAAAVAVLPTLVLGQPFQPWFYRALVLLVISCPCALVISTPVSVVSALAGAARRGVLVKGGLHLERTARVRAVAFDKTGTLTAGRPEVAEVIPLDGLAPEEILRQAAALEGRSEHPIARAILRHARAAGIPTGNGATGFKALPGLGAEATVDGARVVVGNHRLFEERKLCTPAIDAALRDLGSRGRTAVLLARDGRPVGIIGVADAGRASGRETVAALRRQGVERIVMLTGDNADTARAIAGEIGVDEFRAELLPADKVAAVNDLRERWGRVAMVGDGVNDAPALAAADVGIAMGAIGSDAALETADVALMADDLLKVPYLVKLGRATVRNVQANIAFSIGLKAVFLVLAVAGAATLWMAVAADMGASLLVIANGLRLIGEE